MFKRSDYESNEKRKEALINCDPIAWKDVMDLTERIAYKLLRNQSHYGADPDLAPKTIHLIWKNIGNYDPSYPLQTWIATIAKRTLIDDIRKRTAKGRISLGRRINELTDIPDRTEREKDIIASEDLRETIEKLRPDRRSLIEHFYFRGLTLEQYAKLQNIPLGTVKSQLHYALGNIKEILSRKRLCNQ